MADPLEMSTGPQPSTSAGRRPDATARQELLLWDLERQRQHVEAIINDVDPEGLLAIGVPPGEYDSEIDELTRLRYNGHISEMRVLAYWEKRFGPGSSLSRHPDEVAELTARLQRGPISTLTRTEVVAVIDQLLAGTLSREDGARWALLFIDDEMIDDAVNNALCLVVGIDEQDWSGIDGDPPDYLFSLDQLLDDRAALLKQPNAK